MIDLTLLNKDIQSLAIQLLSKCHDLGLNVRITAGFRSPAAQQALFNSGASHAIPAEDPHCNLNEDGTPGALAFDYSCFDDKMTYITDGTNPMYTQVGEIGKSLGLDWGGDWIHHKDFDHFDYNWTWGVSKAKIN